MDFKIRMLRWQHSVQEAPEVLALEVILVVAVIFIGAMFVDGYLKARKKKKRKRG